MNQNPSSEFTPGQIVFLKSNPSTRGAVMAVLPGNPEDRINVFVDGNVQTFYASQLQVEIQSDDSHSFSCDEFHAYLTALQIRYPALSALYSLNAARVDFIPYQYRPVLKFIKADLPRLLIADSVGVGKTIEAGLILRELQARSDISKVLIICPRPLVAEQKWQREMKRFDENFEHLDGKTLQYCIKEMHLDGEWPEQYQKVILPYSLLNNRLLPAPEGSGKKKMGKGLLDLDPPPHFDLVIVIEFGKKAKEKSSKNKNKRNEQREQNQSAQEFGFGSADDAKNAAEFFKEQGKTPDELLKKLHAQKRRKEGLIIDLSDAEEKKCEIRARSIRLTRSTIDPSTALRAQYTADNNKMECQMCLQDMPFKKRNSEDDYFEAVEALGKGYFFKEHEAQYLALCPECAAKYNEVVKKDRKAREDCYNAMKDSDDREIRLELNGLRICIRFEEKHWQDLKTVLYYYENVYNPDEND